MSRPQPRPFRGPRGVPADPRPRGPPRPSAAKRASTKGRPARPVPNVSGPFPNKPRYTNPRVERRAAAKTFRKALVKDARRAGQPAPVFRSFHRGGAAIDYSTGRLVAGWKALRTVTVRGVEITPFIFTQILSNVVTDASGNLGTSTSTPTDAGIALTTSLFDRLQTISAAEDRARLVRLTAHYSPAMGTAVNGKGWWYYEYGGDSIATTPKLASQMAGVKEFVAWQSSVQEWHGQDEVDQQWVKANGNNPFNSKITHKLFMLGNFPGTTSTTIGYLWGRAIVQFTGRQ